MQINQIKNENVYTVNYSINIFIFFNMMDNSLRESTNRIMFIRRVSPPLLCGLFYGFMNDF